MSALRPPRALYVSSGAHHVAAMLHEPDTDMPRHGAVLLLPPFGWEESASFRSRRAWAADLAARGLTVLRVDLPGTGDSTGSARDHDLVDAWIAAADDAARWLRSHTAAPRLAAVGLGLGGLLAVKAVSAGAPIDDLVLWGTPRRGAALVRQMRAFARLQQGRDRAAGADDVLEVAGHVLTEETLAALEGIDVAETSLPPGRLSRVLLLDRDGERADRALRTRFERAAVELTVAPGPGWAGMVGDEPQNSVVPEEVIARVGEWLCERAPLSNHVPAVSRPEPERSAGFEWLGEAIREEAIVVPTPRGECFGFLAQPGSAPQADVTAVFLNAGGVRHTGPHRLWVELSRRWAARGVPTLRVDLPGIGDAEGDAGRFRGQVGGFYARDLAACIVAILDDLEHRGLSRRIVLGGLCSGGYWSFRIAVRDARVRTALIVNPGALVWEDGLDRDRARRRLLRGLLAPQAWRRVLNGAVSRREVRHVARAAALSLVARLRPERSAGAPADAAHREILAGLDTLAARRTRGLLVLAEREAVEEELTKRGIFAAIADHPAVAVERIPVFDHTLRPLSAQRRLVEILDAALATALEPEPVAASAAAPIPARG